MKTIWMGLAVIIVCSAALNARGGERKTKLDFEDQLVEGLNKRPLDSLNSLNDGSGSGKNRHLYRRKTRFDPENRRTLKDLADYSTQR